MERPNDPAHRGASPGFLPPTRTLLAGRIDVMPDQTRESRSPTTKVAVVVGAAVVVVAAMLLVVLALGVGSGTGSESSDTPVERLEVTIEDGTVTPNARRVEVTEGTRIELTVTSDEEDALHVHGYDEEVEVQPGETATLSFIADRAGRFEIETHHTEQLVYQLIVKP